DAGGQQVTRLAVGDIEMDLWARDVTRQDTRLELQPREFSLLELFLRHPGQVLTKTMILEHVWSYDFDPQTNVVDVLVSRLRAKVDREFDPKVIHTVRGVGYAFRPEGNPAADGSS
ncbi:MAG TPA: winged helix-turn-helix domain-containing protein, partial [Alkalispirochaeta sp.]|nr:winged helix-turn-helix domain-containing protein [Alkalispirochaeta sp.]